MRVRLQVHLKQLTENQASAIKSDVRKISGKQIGQVVFVVQSPGGEATARERRLASGADSPREPVGPTLQPRRRAREASRTAVMSGARASS
jgi:hypothetical protein